MAAAIEDVADKSFDYVIIGGGTAGLTLAARLSENPENTVVVLEAGEANLNDPAILRPASYGSHFGNKSYSWDHTTTKQKHLGDIQRPWHRGKGLGGSSGINFMCWSKPPAKEINDFERLGNPGWNWNNYDKFLQRTEGFKPPSQEVQKTNKLKLDTWRIGRQGPVCISYPATIDEAELKIQQTLLNAGFPVAPNPLSGNPKGVFLSPNNYDPRTHTRSYATTAFYLPNRDRSNLYVLVSAHAHHIITEQTADGSFTATGVEFEYDGKQRVVNARKDVILSAGTLKSPQLLELSGIGDAKILEKIGVPKKLDLPGVGENVQEHVFVGVSFELREDVEFETLDLLRDPAIAAKHLELHSTGSGIFTKGVVGFAFASLDMCSSRSGEIYQAAKEEITKNMDSFPPGLRAQYEILLERLKRGAPGCEFISIPGLMSTPNPPEPGKRYLTMLAAANHCFSRGSIHATCNDPAKDPECDPHYFERGVDLDVLCEMVKFTRSLAEVSPLKDMIVKELNPGPAVQEDEQIREWIKANFSTTWHTAGSCSMLPKSRGGVVDPNLKVYGTNNVRVVDLSVVPLHFAAHPQATVYAIAEQAAGIMKGELQV